MYGYFLAAALHPQDAVGKTGVAEVFPADVVKFLRAVRRAHAVDLHDDEAQLGQSPRVPVKQRFVGKRLGHERILRPGVNVFDRPGIFSSDRNFVGRQNHAVNVGHAVAAFGDKPFRRLPAGGDQRRVVGLFQVANQLAVSDRRNSVTGGRSTRDQVSINNFRSGENSTSCVPSPSVSTVRPVPSKFTRQ